MKGVRMLVGNFETDLGVAQAFFELLNEIMLNTDNIRSPSNDKLLTIYILFRVQP